MNGILKTGCTFCLALYALWSPITHGGSHASPLSQVKIAVSTTPLSAPIYIAKVKGFFLNAGLDVSILEIEGGDQCYIALQTGKADVATVSNSVIMFNSFTPTNFEVITSFATTDNDIKIVSLKKNNINSPQDLKHKTVGVVKGSASEYFLHLWLNHAGENIAEVNIRSYFANELPTALSSGEVDAISAWEPFAYISHKLNDDIVIMNTKGLYSFSFSLIGLNNNALLTSTPNGQDKEVKEKITIALNKAVHYIAAHPNESQLILRRHLKLSRRFIDWVWQDYSFKLSLNESFIRSIEDQAQWAMDNGLVSQTTMPNFKQMMAKDSAER
ncbi:ABC transporter substrate-binding protein [Neptuniibacter pectenicola]|jgi:NitT/TauT family transport system substrate-binding protein|uniref:ABC transporter substrate-binding protein n=1 Tax=Neptuniibacter pectenicola TaxID=1806669 RepID=A0ABU9TV39_9GAMM|nr:ABC transporter substrate-binding protein [Neptuniibacter pectenicola]|tara:strand:+ start:3023 stop:4009 length:987 start_codon:yes stop_codon:yes gene_type:complete